MSFLINSMPQSIYQPLGVLNLPEASLETLRFESYQQKQEEALRIDPAVEARELQQQRAEDRGAGREINTSLENMRESADTAGSSAPQTLNSLVMRQQMMDSIAAGEQLARQKATGNTLLENADQPQKPVGSADEHFVERLLKRQSGEQHPRQSPAMQAANSEAPSRANTDAFIADIQRMQAMQFGQQQSRQVSVAA